MPFGFVPPRISTRAPEPRPARTDLRTMPLVDRKTRLARLLSGRRLGVVLSDHTDEDGALLFVHACATARGSRPGRR
jgi:hypothetical protein